MPRIQKLQKKSISLMAASWTEQPKIPKIDTNTVMTNFIYISVVEIIFHLAVMFRRKLPKKMLTFSFGLNPAGKPRSQYIFFYK